jgi:GDPmannose 4,6-dehydratase
VHDPVLARPSELHMGRADPSKAASVLGWNARVRMPEIVRRMMEAEMKPLPSPERQAE